MNIGRTVDVAADASYNAFPSLAVTATGRRVATYYSGTSHVATGAVIKRRFSNDKGASWTSAATVFAPAANAAYKGFLLTFVQVGAVFGIGWRNDQSVSPPKGTIFQARSTDDGNTFGAEQAIAQPFSYLSAIECPIIVLADGTWVTAAYGDNTGGDNLFYSVAIGKSSNWGGTWTWTTIANGPAASKAYTEPTLALLPNGILHLLIRCTTTGDLTMYRATSADGGTTWSALVAAFTGEARPNQTVTSDGALVCLYRSRDNATGRQGVFRVSRDNGVTWGVETMFAFGNQPNGYSHAVEVTPGVLALVTANELNNSICDVFYLHISEIGAPTPFADFGLANREARALLNLRGVIAYDTLDRSDEAVLRRMDTGHAWVNYANSGHRLVSGNIQTVNAGSTPTGVFSAFNTRATDVTQIESGFTFGGKAGLHRFPNVRFDKFLPVEPQRHRRKYHARTLHAHS